MEKEIEKCLNIRKLSTDLFIASVSDSPKVPVPTAGAQGPGSVVRSPGAMKSVQAAVQHVLATAGRQ